MQIGLLVLRCVVGALFVGHGTQKLFGWFGGGGLEETARMFGALGYSPPMAMARAAGATEATAGALLVLGLATPLAGAMIVGVMVNAIVSVHLPKGLWTQNGGFEYPLVNATIGTALAFTGAGAYSLDHALDLRLAGLYSGIWALVVGIGSAWFVLLMRRRQAVRAGGARERRAA
jgi:putative oxidoreductase